MLTPEQAAALVPGWGEHHTVTLEEGERQLILLALATLSLERPGFDFACSEAAKKLGDGAAGDALVMYRQFQHLNGDKRWVALQPREREVLAEIAAADEVSEAHVLRQGLRLAQLHRAGELVTLPSDSPGCGGED